MVTTTDTESEGTVTAPATPTGDNDAGGEAPSMQTMQSMDDLGPHVAVLEAADAGAMAAALFATSGLPRAVLAAIWRASCEGRPMGRDFDASRLRRALQLVALAQADESVAPELLESEAVNDLLRPLEDRQPVFDHKPAAEAAASSEHELSEDDDDVDANADADPDPDARAVADTDVAAAATADAAGASPGDFYPQAGDRAGEFEGLDATLARANAWLASNVGLLQFVSIQTILLPENYLPPAADSINVLRDIATAGSILIYPSQSAGYLIKTFQVVRVWYQIAA
ncbi:uncharacterized protein AMSG_06749 [Thecamonas trahens ATCC 50062]|uniref:Uncharacterized protein n=1 Tax=Thecamonas trahens ATCC 50062 TaxID=461836 RepID=A0A0L0DF45_THETB|nr:hypothetical protein AMSG_06749 [Thecamonas trahens ATCC 50062]KNC50845.1 hypothetical protein AMSG_06749 [Thecamonas trahens ATCC 50062]|eukprot:XP_013756799.1 hypothetical protein AMSG_06749 [Thecamonas trahens ATCC 50062]